MSWRFTKVVYTTTWTNPLTFVEVSADQNRLEFGHALILNCTASIAVPLTTGSFFTVNLRTREGNLKPVVVNYVSSVSTTIHTFRWDADAALTYVESPPKPKTAFAKAALSVSGFNFVTSSGTFTYTPAALTLTTPGTILAGSATATTFVASGTRIENGYFLASVLARATGNSSSTIVTGETISVEVNTTTPIAGVYTAKTSYALASTPATPIITTTNAANPTTWTDATRTLCISAKRTAPSLLNQNFFPAPITLLGTHTLTQLPFNGAANAVDDVFTGTYTAATLSIKLNSTSKNLVSALLIGTRITGVFVLPDTMIVGINTKSYANTLILNQALALGAPASVSFAPILYSSTGLAAGATSLQLESGLSYVGAGSLLSAINGVSLVSESPRIYVTSVQGNVVNLSRPISTITSYTPCSIEIDFVNVGRYDPYHRARMLDIFTFDNLGNKNASSTVSLCNQLFMCMVIDGDGDVSAGAGALGDFTPPNVVRNMRVASIGGTTYRGPKPFFADADGVSPVLTNVTLSSAEWLALSTSYEVTSPLALGMDADTGQPHVARLLSWDSFAQTLTLDTNTVAAVSEVHAFAIPPPGEFTQGPSLELATVYGEYIDVLDTSLGVKPPYVVCLRHTFTFGEPSYEVDFNFADKTAIVDTNGFRSPLARSTLIDYLTPTGTASTYDANVFPFNYFFTASKELVSNSTSEPFQYPPLYNPRSSSAPYIFNFNTLAILCEVASDYLTNYESTTTQTSLANCRGAFDPSGIEPIEPITRAITTLPEPSSRRDAYIYPPGVTDPKIMELLKAPIPTMTLEEMEAEMRRISIDLQRSNSFTPAAFWQATRAVCEGESDASRG